MTERVVKLEPLMSRTQEPGIETAQVLAVVSTRECRDTMAAAAAGLEGLDLVFAGEGLSPEAALKELGEAPDILLFEAHSEDDAVAMLAAAREASVGERLHIGVLLRSPTRMTTTRLLREGANDVLPHMLSELDLSRCIAHASNASVLEPDPTERETRTIVFLHAAGGAGATTLAVNSAVELKKRIGETGEVCILDLDFQFGDTDLHLDLPARSSLTDLVNSPERLDQRMLEDLMIPGPLGIRTLTAPDMPVPLEILSADTIDRVMSVARRHYRYVVVDMPMALTAWTDVVLRKADHICLVTQLNVTALRAARRLLDTLSDEQVTDAPITIVASRVSRQNKVTPQQAQKALERKIAAITPSDYGMLVEGLDQGVPALLGKSGGKYGDAVARLVDRISDHDAGAKNAAKKPLFKFGKA